MKNKKGFIFIETLVVVAVLTASLLMLYSTYNAVIRKEKIRIKYNDSAYLYRTYYLEKFFRNFRLDLVATALNKDDNTKPLNVLAGFGCGGGIFLNEEDNIRFCEVFKEELHITNMYLTYSDLSMLQNCSNRNGACEALAKVNDAAAAYIKTIGGLGKSGYRVIVEFAENKDGTRCEGDDCEFFYATISLGDLS